MIFLALWALVVLALGGCALADRGRSGVHLPHEGIELRAHGGRLVRARTTHSEREI